MHRVRDPSIASPAMACGWQVQSTGLGQVGCAGRSAATISTSLSAVSQDAVARNVSERELKAQIEKLQKQLLKVESSRQAAVRKVVALMNRLGVTLADLHEADGGADAPAQVRKRKAAAPARRQKSPARYRHPDGSEWTGRGRAPRWIRETEEAGGSRDEFLIRN
jgi:DNA-binding protein H-NS